MKKRFWCKQPEQDKCGPHPLPNNKSAANPNITNVPAERFTDPLLDPFLHQADQLIKQGQFMSALKVVDTALKVNPSDNNAFAYKGLVSYRMGNNREA